MRILHLNKHVDLDLPAAGGVGAYIRRLMEVQSRRGHEVRLFGCTPGGAPPGASRRRSAPEGPALPEYVDYKARRSPLLLARMIHDSRAAALLEAFLRTFPADVAHVHNLYHHLTPAVLPVLARRRIGIVMTVHDYRLACPTKHFLRPDGVCMRCHPNRYWRAAGRRCAGPAGAALAIESFVQRFFRRYFRWVDRFLFPSRFLRRVMLQAGLPAGKAVVSRYVVDAPPLPEGVSPRPDELLYVGRLSPEKNPQAMLELARRMPQVRVVIAGDGPLAETLRRQVVRESLGNVELAGQAPHADLGRLYARAAAVVAPSLCLENSPLAVLEAMSVGRCVLASDHPPIREWVHDGRTGLGFDPADASSLERAVRRALDDPAGRQRMARAGRALVQARCNEQAVVDQVQQCYREAIGRCALRW